MALIDWGAVWFDICDCFTTSDVEEQRNQYQKLVNYLEKNLPKLEEKMEQLENQDYSVLFPSLAGSDGGTCKGGLVNQYADKYEITKEKIDGLLSQYREQVNAMKDKLEPARAELEHFKELARIENERKRELERQEQEALRQT